MAEEMASVPLGVLGKDHGNIQDSKIITKLGTVYVGMSEDELYKIFQANDRVLMPQSILNRGWLVFNDWTSPERGDVITFHIEDGKVTEWERRYDPTPANKGSGYEYNGNEIINRWFFPPGNPRWAGSKINLLEWNRLTRIQKVMFIKEHVEYLNIKFNSRISVDIDKYILGMNFYNDNCSGECVDIPADKALNQLLVADGKATKAENNN
jgi:hypothetical protein